VDSGFGQMNMETASAYLAGLTGGLRVVEIYSRSISLKDIKARYGCVTAGDYWRFKDLVNIRTVETGNENYNFLIHLHESIEEWLCTMRGIDEMDIQAFDQQFKGDGEPGDDPAAPYYKEHQFATAIEMLMCNEMGINMYDYDAAVDRATEE